MSADIVYIVFRYTIGCDTKTQHPVVPQSDCYCSDTTLEV